MKLCKFESKISPIMCPHFTFGEAHCAIHLIGGRIRFNIFSQNGTKRSSILFSPGPMSAQRIRFSFRACERREIERIDIMWSDDDYMRGFSVPRGLSRWIIMCNRYCTVADRVYCTTIENEMKSDYSDGNALRCALEHRETGFHWRH